MADYAFYTDVYFGSAIPEKAFAGMAFRAREILSRFQRIYQVSVPGEESLKMAICAMAESLYAHNKRRGGVTAATVGETSVRYETGERADRQLHRELYEKASIWISPGGWMRESHGLRPVQPDGDGLPQKRGEDYKKSGRKLLVFR